MINNIVVVGLDTPWCENVVVDEIFNDAVSLYGREFTTFASCLDAIPISEELLLKNGFLKRVLSKGADGMNEMFEYEKQVDGYWVEILNMSNTIGRNWNVHINNSDRCTCASCDVQYMHQIQNLANILGIELAFVV